MRTASFCLFSWIFPYGIGNGCFIENAILDKNVRIGNRVKISPFGKQNGYESYGCIVVDGIVCVPNGTTLPDDFIF